MLDNIPHGDYVKLTILKMCALLCSLNYRQTAFLGFCNSPTGRLNTFSNPSVCHGYFNEYTNIGADVEERSTPGRAGTFFEIG